LVTMTFFLSVNVGVYAYRAYEATANRLACCSWRHDAHMIHVKTMTLFPSVIVGTCAHRAYEEAVVDRLACCSWVHDAHKIQIKRINRQPASQQPEVKGV